MFKIMDYDVIHFDKTMYMRATRDENIVNVFKEYINMYGFRAGFGDFNRPVPPNSEQLSQSFKIEDFELMYIEKLRKDYFRAKL